LSIENTGSSPAAASGLFLMGLWAAKLQPVPKIDKKFLLALMPVALFHTVGHVFACLSFSEMAVSFAHIVKSAEPVGGTFFG
jgi:solute carrier family 35 protein E1